MRANVSWARVVFVLLLGAGVLLGVAGVIVQGQAGALLLGLGALVQIAGLGVGVLIYLDEM